MTLFITCNKYLIKIKCEIEWNNNNNVDIKKTITGVSFPLRKSKLYTHRYHSVYFSTTFYCLRKFFNCTQAYVTTTRFFTTPKNCLPKIRHIRYTQPKRKQLVACRLIAKQYQNIHSRLCSIYLRSCFTYILMSINNVNRDSVVN